MTVTAPGAAWAYWSGEGVGTGSAAVRSLPAVTVTATSPAFTDRVDLQWSEPTVPVGMNVTGYVVTRQGGPTAVAACGSSEAAPLPAGQLDCADTGVPDGDYAYTVTALVGSWTTAGSPAGAVHVEKDVTPPTVVLRDAASVNALVDDRAGTFTAFVRSSAAAGGSLALDAEVTDPGIGPKEAVFPALASPGWTHGAETVTSGSGSPPTVTYQSSPLVFSAGAAPSADLTVTARDVNGNSGAATLVFVADDTPPTGGALTVNGVAASGAGSSSSATSGSAVISVLTEFGEAESSTQSGLETSVLVRESAPLVAGACGTFAAATVVAGPAPVTQSGLPSGCYRYTLSGADRVGNATSISTVVRMDTTAPAGGALQVNSVDADSIGSTSNATTNGWPIVRTAFADPETDPTTTTLTRTAATLSANTCSVFGGPAVVGSGVTTEGIMATGCYRYALSGVNGAGLTTTLLTTVRLDTTAPSGGALTVNGAVATAGGSTSTSTSGAFAVTALTAFSDPQSGMGGTELVRTTAPVSAGACGAFGSPTVISGTLPIAQSGLSSGCYRYTLIGTNGVGGTASVTTTVRVDTTGPTAAVLTVNGMDATSAGSTSTSQVGSWALVRVDFTDPETPMTSSTLVRTRATLSNGSCGNYSSATTLNGSPTQSGLTTRCYRYVLTGTNALGLVSTVSTIVQLDTSAPSGGALRVNGVTATAGGLTSNAGAADFDVATLTPYADTDSGMEGTTLIRTSAPITAGTCGAYDPGTSTTLVGPAPIVQSGLATGCYRYVLTGTNGVGGTASVTTTVRVDTTAPEDGDLTVNSVAGGVTDTVSYSPVIGWPIARTAFSDPDTVPTTTLTRAVATYAAGVCGTYGTTLTTIGTGTTTEGSLTTGCYRYVLRGVNTSGLASTVSTVVRLDTSVPTGGALTVNAVAASAAGTASTSTTGTFTVSAMTAFADTNSGMAGTTLVRTQAPVSAGVCGTFDPGTATTLSGPVPIAQSGLAPGCYRYVLTGTNGVGGTATVSSTVRVDTTPPTAAVLTVNGVDGAAASTTSGNATGAFAIAVTGFSDPESTVTNVLTRALAPLTSGTCGTYAAPTVITGSTTQSGLATGCYRYTLTGTNSLTLAASISTIVVVDTSVPTGGALTVNGAAATAGGSSSTSVSGAFTVSALTPYSDAQSGMGSSAVTRTTAPSVAGVCGTFDPGTATTISGSLPIAQSLAVGCYRYTLAGVNAVGGSATLTTTVRVGP